MPLVPGGSVLHQGVGWPHLLPTDLDFEAPLSGNLYIILNSQFQMLLSSPKLGCRLCFLTSPPSPHLSSPTKSWRFYVQNMHPVRSLCPASLTSTWFKACRSSRRPMRWLPNGPPTAAVNCFKTQSEPSFKFFILPVIILHSPSSFPLSQLVITCFFLPLFSCLSSPLTCQFHEGIRPTLYTGAAQ